MFVVQCVSMVFRNSIAQRCELVRLLTLLFVIVLLDSRTPLIFLGKCETRRQEIPCGPLLLFAAAHRPNSRHLALAASWLGGG